MRFSTNLSHVILTKINQRKPTKQKILFFWTLTTRNRGPNKHSFSGDNKLSNSPRKAILVILKNKSYIEEREVRNVWLQGQIIQMLISLILYPTQFPIPSCFQTLLQQWPTMQPRLRRGSTLAQGFIPRPPTSIPLHASLRYQLSISIKSTVFLLLNVFSLMILM